MSKKLSKAARNRKAAKLTGTVRNKPSLWSRWTPDEHKMIRELVEAGESNIDIQARMKRSMASVARYATPFRKARRKKLGL